MLSTHFSLYCFPHLALRYNSLLGALSIPVLVAVFHPHFEQPKHRTTRAVVFVGFGLCNVISVLHAGLLQGFLSIQFWRHASYFGVAGMFYLLGARLYAVRWPERSYPDGRFDCYLNSHNILHIAVVLGCLVHFIGGLDNFYYRMNHGCEREVFVRGAFYQ
mmetsp:Transcript_25819/g.62694  ORF Transcript_25819/g.62694 Transcript_25819/m.62694 type:complete len:161 (+) Transcript_25819:1-483(+)